MPNQIRFFSKVTPATPANLNALDAEICGVVGDPVHPTAWCRGWFDYIGALLAFGRTYTEVRTILTRDGNLAEYGKILDHLEKNYTVDAWYSR